MSHLHVYKHSVDVRSFNYVFPYLYICLTWPHPIRAGGQIKDANSTGFIHHRLSMGQAAAHLIGDLLEYKFPPHKNKAKQKLSSAAEYHSVDCWPHCY